MAILINRWFETFKHAFARGTFPHEMSFILEWRWRNWLLSPEDLVKRLPLKKDSRVLEVGSGSGFYSVAVAKAIPEGKLELLDLQTEMLEKARLKIQNFLQSLEIHSGCCFHPKRISEIRVRLESISKFRRKNKE